MSEVVLTRVFRKDVETKYGIKPKLSIQTETHGDKWLSTFNVEGTGDWSEGDTVQIDISEKGDFINFKPRGGGSSSGSSSNGSSLESRVVKLEAAVFGGGASTTETVISADDLPDMEDEEAGDGF